MLSKSIIFTRLERCVSNILTTQRRFVQLPKRFYKDVSISQNNDLYEVNLDKRKLKTPLGRVFQVPNETLALAVAAEWNAQQNIIRLSNMHLTNLCNTVLDNPSHSSQESLIESILDYLPTDTICYTQDEPVELAALEEKEWGQILEWFCKRYKVDIKLTSSITGPNISNETKETIRNHIASYNFSSLVGMNSALESLKSVILMLSTVDCHLSVEKAVFLSRLELEFQIQRWGNVEWAHDIELMDLQARVAAAIMFVHLNRQSSTKRLRTSNNQSTNINFI